MLPTSGPAPQQIASSALAAAESGGARRSALLLHAMAPVDRDWVLAALPLAQRDELRRLLGELEALGIERDAGLIADATAESVDAASSASMPEFDTDARQLAPMSNEAWLHTLDASRLQALAQCLRAEPAGLVAQWLRLADWPWRGDLLAALEPVQRRRVETILAAAVAGPGTPPGMRAVLISTLAARLQGPVPVADAAVAPWQRLKHSVERLLQSARFPGSTPR